MFFFVFYQQCQKKLYWKMKNKQTSKTKKIKIGLNTRLTFTWRISLWRGPAHLIYQMHLVYQVLKLKQCQKCYKPLRFVSCNCQKVCILGRKRKPYQKSVKILKLPYFSSASRSLSIICFSEMLLTKGRRLAVC